MVSAGGQFVPPGGANRCDIYAVLANGPIEETGRPIPLLTWRGALSELVLLLLNANAVRVELLLNPSMYLSDTTEVIGIESIHDQFAVRVFNA